VGIRARAVLETAGVYDTNVAAFDLLLIHNEVCILEADPPHAALANAGKRSGYRTTKLVVSLCTPSPFTPLGMKGVGEGGAIAPGACLANAVSDALAPLGAAVDATPMTPEVVLRLIRGA
jgi:hypothetical protein